MAKDGLKLEDDGDVSHLYLGHRRLAILDRSISGHQPMSRDGLVWIVFNGEIYNYLELRAELSQLGCVFRSESDTEVILAAYQVWGHRCVERFNGDWAFCILDLRQRDLFLSRDRFGVKPLFYFSDTGRFAFASELKALLSVPGIPHELDAASAQEYLLHFALDHTESTFFRGLRRLMPGHAMTVNLDSLSIRTWQYYSTTLNTELGRFDSGQARRHATEVRTLLSDAVRLRLRADVRVGTCLSGGLDSSAVAALVAELDGDLAKGRPLFTACFPGQTMDEERYAGLVASRVNGTWRKVYPTYDGCRHYLSTMTHHQDEPFGGPGLYAQWAVMADASELVRVVLDGQGGDEVFGGYRNHRQAYIAQLVKAGRWGQAASEVSVLLGREGGWRGGLAEVKALPLLLGPPLGRAAVQRIRSMRQMGWHSQSATSRPGSGLFQDPAVGSDLNRQLMADLVSFTLPHLLRFEDRNSMAHSIESRVPFTDHRLVDYLSAVPACFKIHRGWTKYLLRLAVEDLLPAEIVWRHSKVGFSAPPWVSRQEIWRVWLGQHGFVDPSLGAIPA